MDAYKCTKSTKGKGITYSFFWGWEGHGSGALAVFETPHLKIAETNMANY